MQSSASQAKAADISTFSAHSKPFTVSDMPFKLNYLRYSNVIQKILEIICNFTAVHTKANSCSLYLYDIFLFSFQTLRALAKL